MKIISAFYLLISSGLFLFSIFGNIEKGRALFGIVSFIGFLYTLILFLYAFFIRPLQGDINGKANVSPVYGPGPYRSFRKQNRFFSFLSRF